MLRKESNLLLFNKWKRDDKIGLITVFDAILTSRQTGLK